MQSGQKANNKIIFLLKTMKHEYVEETMKKGRFCFNHPTVFNKWEKVDSAQYDRWDAHSAYNADHLIFAPIIGEKDGKPVYGKIQKLADKAIIHEQSKPVKHSPICCFRYVEKHEVIIEDDGIIFSLGNTADRIIKEFGHDSFIMIQALPFLKRIRSNYQCYCGDVVYKDTLNDYDFDVPDQIKDHVEQLFRKDKSFEWQKEYRVVLTPTDNSPVFIELGSIEDIAISGSLSLLRD